MNVRKAERIERELEAEYGNLLRILAQMPKETNEDRDKRWKWFQSQPQYEPLFLKVMEAYMPLGYKQVIQCKGDGDLLEMSYKKNQEIGSVEFVIAVKETVEYYTEEKAEEGKTGTFFVACVRTKYRQEIQRACGAEWYDRRGPMQEIPYKRKYQVRKYVYTLKEMIDKKEIEERQGFWEERREEICRSKGWEITRKEWEVIVRSVYDMNVLVSLDDSVGDEEDGGTFEQFVADQTERAEEKEEREEREAFLGTFISNLAKDWKYVQGVTNKRSREWIRIFLTRDILVSLKLDSLPELTDKERRQWRDYEIEPYCGQWCSRRKRCTRKGTSGCYVRYQKKPAGTEGVYRLLESNASVIFHKLLVSAYVNRAIEGEPANLYEVYENYLRNDFDFRDKILGEVIHKDKSAVSRARSEYEGRIKEELYRQYLREAE